MLRNCFKKMKDAQIGGVNKPHSLYPVRINKNNLANHVPEPSVDLSVEILYFSHANIHHHLDETKKVSIYHQKATTNNE